MRSPRQFGPRLTWHLCPCIFARWIRISMFGRTKSNSSMSEHAKHGPVLRVNHDAMRSTGPFYVFWNQRRKLPNQYHIPGTWFQLLFPWPRGMNSKSLVDTSRIVLREFSLELGRTYIHVFFHVDHEYRSAINWFWEEHGGTWWQSGQNRQSVKPSVSKSMATVQNYISGFYIKNGLTNVALASLENIFQRTWFWALKSFWDRQVPLILNHDLTQSIPQRFSGRGIRIWPQRRSIPSGRSLICRSKIFLVRFWCKCVHRVPLEKLVRFDTWHVPTFNLLCEEHEGTLELQKFSGRTRVFFQGILSKNMIFLIFSLSSNSIVFIDRGRKKQQAVKAVSNVLSTTTIRFHVFDGQVCQIGRLPQSGVC